MILNRLLKTFKKSFIFSKNVSRETRKKTHTKKWASFRKGLDKEMGMSGTDAKASWWKVYLKAYTANCAVLP